MLRRKTAKKTTSTNPPAAETSKHSAMENILLLTDSYKISHYPQYPPKTTEVYSYFESRGGLWNEVCFFGLQYIIERYLVGQVVTQAKIDEAEAYFNRHLPTYPFNREGWEYILHQHQGKLPVSIKAVPEGTVVPGKNILLSVVNTDPACFWLTNYLETLLVQVWYPMTVCTNSREQKRILLRYLRETGDPNLIDFKLHDFGFRGVSSVESAGIGGCAHLVNFKGTDTVIALVVASEYYDEPNAGFSIPASEHSTITSWGQDREGDAMENMLRTYDKGLVACVSDSFNVFNACEKIWGERLKDLIMSRDGTLVVRPDSGDPVEVVLKCHELLGNAFGYTVNEKGYRVLDPHVRLIQGDGVDIQSLQQILEALKQAKWSADNIAFGSGGALLQKLNRDTLKCAFKCSSIVVDSKRMDVWKDPITDPGKQSKRGKLALIQTNGVFQTVSTDTPRPDDVLVEVFRDGAMTKSFTFSEIRERAARGL